MRSLSIAGRPSRGLSDYATRPSYIPGLHLPLVDSKYLLQATNAGGEDREMSAKLNVTLLYLQTVYRITTSLRVMKKY